MENLLKQISIEPRYNKHFENVIILEDIECEFEITENVFYKELANNMYIMIEEENSKNGYYYIQYGKVDTNDYIDIFTNESGYNKIIGVIKYGN